MYRCPAAVGPARLAAEHGCLGAVALSTFAVIFLAEMGDKTQLAAMTMAADSKRPWAVFLGASLALTCVSALGVFVGAALSTVLPMEMIKKVAGGAFVVIGVLMLANKL